MNDLIYRQDAIELAMQYCPDDDGTCSKADEDIRNLLDELEDLPSAQPEIIRCKDCTKREHCRTSTVWAVAPNDDWYCADAERITDD